MTYTPNRITKRNIETDETEIDSNSIQRNLDLISKETKSLQNQINSNSTLSKENRMLVRTQTRFVNVFLFG